MPMLCRKRLMLALKSALLVGTMALLAAPSAEAGVIFYSAGSRELRYEHNAALDGDSRHVLTADRSGGVVRLTDTQTDIYFADEDSNGVADAPCQRDGTPRVVTCDGERVSSLSVFLSDLPDDFTVTGVLSSSACGGGGNDLLNGGSAADQMSGGRGRDELRGGGGSDILTVASSRGQAACQAGSDVPDGEVLEGGEGADRIDGGGGADRIDGGGGGDLLYGFGAADRMAGGDGDDTLIAFAGADVLGGGPGSDSLFGGDGDDRVTGGEGADRLGVSAIVDANGLGAGSESTLVVEDGDDVLDAGSGDDVLFAGPGPFVFDTVDPVAVAEGGFVNRKLASPALNGADTYAGGPGVDFITYANRAAPVTVTLDGARDDGSAGERDLVEADIEEVFGGPADDVLVAAPSGTLLFGDSGDDLVVGGAGPDRLRGGTDVGADTLLGNGGDDDAAAGPGDDLVGGGDGNDDLFGGDGADRMFGDAGSDGLQGGTGPDRLDGGAEVDCLHGFVFVDADDPARFCPKVSTDLPGAGADGGDVLIGGDARDLLAGGGGEDIADYEATEGSVLVALAGVDPGRAATYRPWDEWDLILADVEGARGGRGADTLLGNARDNLLAGGPGDDQVEGGGGADRLGGGTGRDVLVARDGFPDAVSCGAADDLALVDMADEVGAARSDLCEVVDGDGSVPAARLPRLAAAAACPLRINLPRVGRSFLLAVPFLAPVGTLVVATDCPARVRPPSRSGRRPRVSSVLRGGAFRVRLVRRARTVIAEIDRRSAEICRSDEYGELGRLDADGRAGVSVRGRAATVSSDRARWTTSDRCDGTLVTVTAGRVRVVDRRGRVRSLAAGGRLLLRARSPEEGAR